MTDQDPTQRYEPAAGDPPSGEPVAASAPPAPSTSSAPAPAGAESSPTMPDAAAGPPSGSPPAPQPLAAQPPSGPPPAPPAGSPYVAPPRPEPALSTEMTPPAATAPVTVQAASRPGRSRARWLIAVVVSLLVVGTAAGATYLLTRESGEPGVLAWTPADTVLYAELRLDLPGGQRAELAKAMSAFPGFDDQAAFPTKLNEALDQLVKRASNDKMGYQADIVPWFGGQVSMSVGPLPSAGGPSQARALLLASVTDAAKAEAWAKDLLTESGATSSTETYNGVEITTVTPPDLEAFARPMTGAYALFGPVIALGDQASVKAAIDTKGSNGLATKDQFKTAAASISGDRLGFVYVDTAAIAKGARGLAGGAVPSGIPEMPAILGDLSAPWTAMALRAKDGAFVAETRTPHVDKLGPASSAESRLPALLPPTTVALVEGHDLGQSLERIKSLAGSDPQLSDGVKQLDDALKIVGGFGSVVDWMGEAGVAITRSGDGVAGGIVVTPTDKPAADKLLTQLRGFLELGGATAGIKVSDEPYGGATITVIDLSALGPLASQTAGIPASGLPANLAIAYTVTDQAVVLGSGTDFVKAVLDARTGDSLAKSDRFAKALSRVDKVHGSLSWIDVAGLRDLLEAQLPAADKGDYDANLKPYVDAFDSIISTSTPGDDLDRGTMVLLVASS